MEALLNKQQVAELLTISVKTLECWIRKGVGPKPIRIGRLVRFKHYDVETFIKNLSSEEK